jgi:hypothetical protein
VSNDLTCCTSTGQPKHYTKVLADKGKKTAIRTNCEAPPKTWWLTTAKLPARNKSEELALVKSLSWEYKDGGDERGDLCPSAPGAINQRVARWGNPAWLCCALRGIWFISADEDDVLCVHLYSIEQTLALCTTHLSWALQLPRSTVSISCSACAGAWMLKWSQPSMVNGYH